MADNRSPAYRWLKDRLDDIRGGGPDVYLAHKSSLPVTDLHRDKTPCQVKPTKRYLKCSEQVALADSA